MTEYNTSKLREKWRFKSHAHKQSHAYIHTDTHHSLWILLNLFVFCLIRTYVDSFVYRIECFFLFFSFEWFAFEYFFGLLSFCCCCRRRRHCRCFYTSVSVCVTTTGGFWSFNGTICAAYKSVCYESWLTSRSEIHTHNISNFSYQFQSRNLLHTNWRHQHRKNIWKWKINPCIYYIFIWGKIM